MAEKKYVYICYGWDDYEGGTNYIAFDKEDDAKDWIDKSVKLTNNYYTGPSLENKKIDKELAKMNSERCDNYKYIKMEIV